MKKAGTPVRTTVVKPEISIVDGDILTRELHPSFRHGKFERIAIKRAENDPSYAMFLKMARSSLYGKFVPYDGPDPEIDLMTEELANSKKNQQ